MVVEQAPRAEPISVSSQSASQGPKSAVGGGPAASADGTPEMRFAGERERGCETTTRHLRRRV